MHPAAIRALAARRYGDGHSDEEERWVTIGLDASGNLLVVVHTFEEVNETRCKIRLISARRATKKEAEQYQRDR
jgi:uncharacterized protein